MYLYTRCTGPRFQFITTQPVSEPLTLFKVGQTVKCKVIQVDTERERFLLSLTSSDCYHGDVDESMDVLDGYLADYQFIRDRHRSKKGK